MIKKIFVLTKCESIKLNDNIRLTAYLQTYLHNLSREQVRDMIPICSKTYNFHR